VPTIEDWNVYVNFVILAVTGRMGEADAVMRQRGDAVRSMAMWLRTGAPGWPGPGQALAAYAEKVTGATLWRGLLLEPEKIKRKTKKGRSLRVLQPDPQLTFLSFSFDRDVACWFADRESVISGYVAQQRPKATGWLARYDKARPRQILWISAWDAIPLPDGSGRAIPLAAAAAQYPGLPADQFAWNLQTQREVILDAERWARGGCRAPLPAARSDAPRPSGVPGELRRNPEGGGKAAHLLSRAALLKVGRAGLRSGPRGRLVVA